MKNCARFFCVCLCLIFSSITPLHAQTEAAAERSFSRIDVTGNSRFRDEDVRATADLRPGVPYTRDDIVAAVEALEFTGEFKTVRVFSRGGVLTIEVDDAPEFTGNLSFGLGYDSDIGAFGTVGLRLDDILNGRTFEADLTYSPEVLITKADLSGGSFWPGGRPGGVRAGFSRFDYDDALFDFESATLSPYLGFGNRDDGFAGEVRLTGLWTDITSVDATGSAIIQAEAGDRFVFGPGLSLNWSDAETKSWAAGLQIDVFRGDADFVEASLAFNWDTPFVGPTFIRSRARVGAVTAIGDSSTTVADRRVLGGSSMRGFARGGITPVDFCAGCGAGGADVTTDLGGERYAVLQVDLMLPKFSENLPFTPSVYFDVGSAWDIDTATAPSGVLFDERSWRTSYGLAVTAETPFGDLSASYAVDSDGEFYDDTASFGLSFTSRF